MGQIPLFTERISCFIFGRPFVNGSPYAICPLSVLSVAVCLSCLSVTFVHCGQTAVGWMKMKRALVPKIGPDKRVRCCADGDF